MRQLLRLASCAALVGLFLAFAPALRLAVPGDMVPDLREWARLRARLAAEAERQEEMRRRVQAAMRVGAAKDRVCLDLVAGRCTLSQAAEQFRALPDTAEEVWRQIRRKYAGTTDEECVRRHVIAWACAMLQGEPDHADDLRRLLAELPTNPQEAEGRRLGGAPPDRPAQQDAGAT